MPFVNLQEARKKINSQSVLIKLIPSSIAEVRKISSGISEPNTINKITNINDTASDIPVKAVKIIVSTLKNVTGGFSFTIGLWLLAVQNSNINANKKAKVDISIEKDKLTFSFFSIMYLNEIIIEETAVTILQIVGTQKVSAVIMIIGFLKNPLSISTLC